MGGGRVGALCRIAMVGAPSGAKAMAIEVLPSDILLFPFSHLCLARLDEVVSGFSTGRVLS